MAFSLRLSVPLAAALVFMSSTVTAFAPVVHPLTTRSNSDSTKLFAVDEMDFEGIDLVKLLGRNQLNRMVRRKASIKMRESNRTPPKDPRVGSTEMLVKKAANLLNTNGAKAWDELRTEKYFKGSTYVFSYDLDCNVLFNAASPEKEGHHVDGLVDINGKLFHNALAAVDPSGWVTYTWPKPGETEGSVKWTYATKVNIDGKDAVVQSGFYL